MWSSLSGIVDFLLFQSGCLGGKLTRRDLEQIVKMVLLPRENALQGARLVIFSLPEQYFPEQKGVVVSKDAPVPNETAKDLFHMSLEEIISDIEWEPTVMEILNLEVSLDVIEPEKEDPVEPEPEPVPDKEPEKEKNPVAPGSR